MNQVLFRKEAQVFPLGGLHALGFLLVVAVAGPAPAGAQMRLTIRGSANFPDSDPDLVPVIGPSNVDIDVWAIGVRGRPWNLTMVADQDLRSGADVIPANNISWTVVPAPPFRSGTLSTTVPVLIASGQTHTQTTATFSFFFRNSWNYVPGNYTTTTTFTLTSP